MSVVWAVQATEFANCNCAYGCGCQFNALPDKGFCEAVAGYQITLGHLVPPRSGRPSIPAHTRKSCHTSNSYAKEKANDFNSRETLPATAGNNQLLLGPAKVLAPPCPSAWVRYVAGTWGNALVISAAVPPARVQ